MDTDGGQSGSSGTGPDHGLAVALAAARAGSEKADTYLDETTRLVRLQIEQIEGERPFGHFAHFSAVMKAAFEGAVALVAIAVIVALGAAVWSAARSDGLVIEPFSVPSDMAARGLTGQVIAARLLDRLSQLQAQTGSSRAPSSYANNWGDDVKVQIPETGVSIGQLYDYLCRWLGHETRISGEIWRDPSGRISIAARVGADASPAFTGSEAGLGALMQKTAESVYRATQPYRYAVYLANANRTKEAEAAYLALIANGPVLDRAWAYIGIEGIYQNRADERRAEQVLYRALALKPGFVMAYTNLAALYGQLQHDEASLQAQKKTVELLQRDTEDDIAESARKLDLATSEAVLASDLGDYRAQLAYNREAELMPDLGTAIENARESDIQAFASAHDAADAAAAYADLPPVQDARTQLVRHAVHMLTELLLGHWQPALAQRKEIETGLTAFGPQGPGIVRRQFWPYVAYALARSGDMKAAHRLIDRTPADCVICLRQRGRIDALEKNWAGAEYWLARAARAAPTPPFVWTDWGQVLLAKGDYDGAIAKYEIAHARGPHFADPLEGWGEALIARNRSDLALAKFEEANKFAPSWGRLHLKWGEALMWSGDRQGAQKQFAIASGLDLTAAEKSELLTGRKANG